MGQKLTQEEIHEQIGPSRVSAPNGDIILLTRLAEFRKDHLEHNIPLGSIVEYSVDNSNYPDIGIISGTLRLYVIAHTRDCDGEPLYQISDSPVGTEGETGSFCEMARLRKMLAKITLHGLPEDSLTVIDNNNPFFWRNAKEQIESFR